MRGLFANPRGDPCRGESVEGAIMAVSRRFVILSGIAAAGGLAVGYALMPYSTVDRARKLIGKDGATALSAWIRIGADNTVTVFVPHSEIGQGAHTALPMMAAEEL